MTSALCASAPLPYAPHAVNHEGRAHPRVQTGACADVIGSEVVLAIDVADLSMGGCRFPCPAWEDEGRALQLLLKFAEPHVQLPLQARVVRATQQEMSVRFEGLTEDDKWTLRRALRQLASARGLNEAGEP